MTAVHLCTICGGTMDEAESMFKFHGSLGPCPRPPLPRPILGAVIECMLRETGGEFWLDIHVNREVVQSLGPFQTASERQRAHDYMLAMMRSVGAVDLPAREQ